MKKLIRLPGVKELTGLSRSSVYAKIADGSYPRSISIGERAVAWIEDEVQNWIERQIAGR
jgi:prophage regulatory protein